MKDQTKIENNFCSRICHKKGEKSLGKKVFLEKIPISLTKKVLETQLGDISDLAISLSKQFSRVFFHYLKNSFIENADREM